MWIQSRRFRGSTATARDVLILLEKRAYSSYLARLHAERRLRAHGHWWQAAQIALAGGLIAVSIVNLVEPAKAESSFAAFMVILAVMSLVVSIVVNFLNYAARARDMFWNYRALQAFSVEIEATLILTSVINDHELVALHSRYNSMLDQSENHLPIDHKLAQSQGVTKLPLQNQVQFLAPFLLPATLVLASIFMTTWTTISAFS